MTDTALSRRSLYVKALVVLLLVIVAGIIIWSRLPEDSKDDIRIVVLLPETGKFSFIGIPVRRGLDLAATDLGGKVGARRLRLFYEDFREDTSVGVQALQQYLDGPKRAHAVVSVLTGMTNAAKEYTERHEIPLFAVTIHPTITRDNKYLFRIYYSAGDEGKALAEFVVKAKPRTAAVLVSADPQTEYAADRFLIPALEEHNVSVGFKDSYKVGTADFGNLVTRCMASKPDVLIVPGAYAPDVRSLFRELQRRNLAARVRLYGGIAFLDVATKFPAEAIEGMHFVAPPFVAPGVADQAARGVVEKYRTRYNEAPVHEVGYAYDTLRVIAKGVENAASLKGSELRAGIRRVSNYPGVSGTISVGDDNDVRLHLLPCLFRNGRIARADTAGSVDGD